MYALSARRPFWMAASSCFALFLPISTLMPWPIARRVLTLECLGDSIILRIRRRAADHLGLRLARLRLLHHLGQRVRHAQLLAKIARLGEHPGHERRSVRSQEHEQLLPLRLC